MTPSKTLTDLDITNAAKELGIQEAWIRAFIQKEVKDAGRSGFLATGEPTILFERHKFHLHTNGIHSAKHPDISNRIPGGYGKYSDQHLKLARAIALNRNAALMSASWGLFQVLGENWESLGYKSVQSFVNAMYRSEKDQLDAFVRFIKVNGLVPYMKKNDFATVARRYNGPKYKANKYDIDLKKYFLRFGGKL